MGKHAIRAIGAGFVGRTRPVGAHKAVERDFPILRNEMRSLRHGLSHEEMIEGITVMKRKSSKSD